MARWRKSPSAHIHPLCESTMIFLWYGLTTIIPKACQLPLTQQRNTMVHIASSQDKKKGKASLCLISRISRYVQIFCAMRYVITLQVLIICVRMLGRYAQICTQLAHLDSKHKQITNFTRIGLKGNCLLPRRSLGTALIPKPKNYSFVPAQSLFKWSSTMACPTLEDARTRGPYLDRYLGRYNCDLGFSCMLSLGLSLACVFHFGRRKKVCSYSYTTHKTRMTVVRGSVGLMGETNPRQ